MLASDTCGRALVVAMAKGHPSDALSAMEWNFSKCEPYQLGSKLAEHSQAEVFRHWVSEIEKRRWK